MAKNLKGITIEIGAETQKLTAALNKINGQSRDLQSELRRVEQLLRFDPENTELLAQRQEILSEAIRETETRVESLKRVGEQMQEKLNRGEITTQQFREMQREIVRAEQDLNRLRQSADALNEVEAAADEAGDAIEELGEDAENAGEETGQMADQMAEMVKKAAIGAAGVGAAVKAFKVSDEITDSMNRFRAATGATAEETEAMGQSMKELYNSNLGESFEDIAETMALVNQRTGQTGEELENTSKAALLLRDTFDIDVNEGIRGADALMRQFGLTAEEAYTYIANGAQQGLNQNQDLADQIAEYSVHYAALGLSVDDMFKMMAAGAESGAFQIDYLNDAIKEFGIRAKDNSDSTRQAFADLGIEDLTEEFAAGGERASEAFKLVVEELAGMDDQVKQNEIGVALFGTKWEDLGVKAMEALTTANTEVSFTKNSLESINEIRYDSFGAALEGIKRQVETNILAPIGQEATPALQIFSQGLQLAIDHAGELAPVATAGASAIVTFTAATKAHTVATNAAATASKALNLVMNANPAAKVVTVIATLTAAFVTAYKTNETFRNGVNQTWQSFKNGAATVANGVATIKNTVIKGFQELPNKMKQAGKDIVSGLLSGITGGAGNVIKNISSLGSRAVQAFKDKLGIKSPSKVFQAIGNNIVEGLNIGINEKAGYTVDEIAKLGDAILNTGDAISTGLISVSEKTGEATYNNLYKNMMKRLTLYDKERNQRISSMEGATEDNIKAINREVEATRTATDAKIKLYQQEYAAKVALIDNETSEATRAIQSQIDAINAQQEQENRAEEQLEYMKKMQELQQEYDSVETVEERYKVEQKIAEAERDRKKKLLQQERQDKIESLRDEMDAIREQADQKKAALQQELEAKQYQLEQQRLREIEYMQQVIALMQAQVDKKKELEELQTQIVAKEKELQTKKMDAETKKQTQAELDALREKEKNLKASLAEDEKALQDFLPKVKNLSNQYGDAFLSGFKSTESRIKSYFSDLASAAQSQIATITAGFMAVKGLKVNGSHKTGLPYVPFDGYIAELHRGERVLTAGENRAYSGSSGGTVQNIFNVQATIREESDIKRVAQELYSLQQKDARGRGVVMA